MIKKSLALLSAGLLAAQMSGQLTPKAYAFNPAKPVAQSPGQIIAAAQESDWRQVDSDNLMILTLQTGSVYLEVNPLLAPKHAQRLRELTKAGFYQGLSMYRFVEGFVAQGGAGEQKTDIAPLQQEFVWHSEQPMPLDIQVNDNDGYAPRSGFINGFAVGQNEAGTQTWQLHCMGALGMARGNGVDSATSEFYVVIGHAPRYLDKNITVFGRVLSGMEHLQQLQRPDSKKMPFNPIQDLQFASQLEVAQQPKIRVMRTDSPRFGALVAARKNRPEDWFVATPNYIDTCAMAVPSVIDD
ncbi:peptidylprolyl isomerase [Pseudoalteromonas sp. T1lg88]|uniref:peptidylprolyl isomerase n=1 Tax=Pseudoalteromonas sp. T1lg88 TaxID=2077104 RepID=UPI000CF67F21|nr:peptidylprolyl isomerase [Pseudoalteromonas sp. T1lg88]